MSAWSLASAQRALGLGALAGALLLAAAPAASRGRPIPSSYRQIEAPPLRAVELPRAERHVLANGLVIFTLEDHELPLVGGSARLRSGSIYDPPAKLGLAALSAEVMRSGGTTSLAGDDLDLALESRAASLETGMGLDSGSASFSCLRDDLDWLLGQFAEVLMHPAFPEEKLELARVQASSAIARRNDDVTELAAREFRKALYGPESPWARQSELETIAAISRDDLIAFHASWSRPDHVVLGIWGDFETRALLARLEAVFGSWAVASGPNGTILPALPARPAVPTSTARAVFVVDKPDVGQTSLRFGHMGVRWDDPDAYALEVLSEILGSGVSSRLFRRVRSDAGLAYSVGARFEHGYEEAGLFRVAAATRSDSTAATTALILEELDRIRDEPVRASELETAKAGILNSFVFSFDTKREIVTRQVEYAYHGYPADFLDRYRPGISAVSIEDIQRVAREHLRPADLVLLAAGRVAEFDGPLDRFGRVQRIDLAAPSEAAPPAEGSASALLEQVLAAAGGRSAWLALKSLTTRFAFDAVTLGGGMKATGTRSVIFPDRLRTTLSMPIGQHELVLLEGEGWRQLAGTQYEMSETELQRARVERDHDLAQLMRRAAANELAVAFAAPGEAQPTTERVLELTAQGIAARLTIDAASSRPLRLAWLDPVPKGTRAMEESYSEFRRFGSLELPTRIELSIGGKLAATRVVEDVSIDPDGLAAEFARKPGEAGPAAAEAGAK